MFVNIWLVLSNAAQAIVLESINWPDDEPYTGPLRPRSRRLFRYMSDQATRRRLFEKATLQGTVYNLWTIEFTDDRDTLQQIRDELDFLIANFPAQIQVCGAWHWNGFQIGVPRVYPIPSWLWRFMPAALGATSNADLIDVNLVLGQSPRDFS